MSMWDSIAQPDIRQSDVRQSLWDIPPEMWRSLAEPPKVWSGPITPAESQEYNISQNVRGLEEQLSGQRGLEDTSDMLLNFTDPMQLHQLGKAALKGLPLAAGMIRMGGKEFPNAVAIRSMMNPDELISLRSLWKDSIFPEKPATINTPSHLPTFQGNDYGLVFNAPNPEDIVHAGYSDLNSLPKSRYASKGKTNPNIDDMSWEYRQDEARRYLDEMATKSKGDDRKRYKNALNVLDQWYSPQTETWIPSHPELLIDKEKEGLDSLFAKQLAYQPTWGALGKTNEAIVKMTPENLAGIKLPWDKTNDIPDITEAFHRFGERYNVPTWRIPGLQTREQFLMGLEEPFKGKWGYKQGSRDYITSSMLPKIFGITELP